MRYKLTSSLLIVFVFTLLGCGSTNQGSDGEKKGTETVEKESQSDQQDAGQPGLPSGSTVLVGFNDGLVDGTESESFFAFEAGELKQASWIKSFKEKNGIENGDGRALQKAIEADNEQTAEVVSGYDIFLDASHGLICNTPFDGWELGFGKGAIVDMGEVPIEQIVEAPEYVEFGEGDGYSPLLRFDTDAPPAIAKYPVLAEGHTYVVRTANGKFAKFHVKALNLLKDENPGRVTAESIELDWVFQPDGTRKFE